MKWSESTYHAAAQPLDIRVEYTNSAEFGRAIPWIIGTVRLGGTFIGEPWDYRAIPQKRGKKSGTTTYSYTASWLMAYCAGPISALEKVIVDNNVVWEGRLSGPDPCEFAVEGYGLAKIYWGTPNQARDPYLPPSHFAYPGVAYIIFKQWTVNTYVLPNVEIVATRVPSVELPDIPATNENGINPVHAVLDLLLDPEQGPGLPVEMIDWNIAQQSAGYCHARGIGIGGFVSNPTSLATIIKDMLDPVGLVMSWRGGKICVHAPGRQPIQVGPDQLLAPATLSLESTRLRSIAVNFDDRRYNFERNSIVCHCGLDGEFKSLDAPFVNTSSMAKYVAAVTTRRAMTACSCLLSLPPSYRHISPGDLLALNDDTYLVRSVDVDPPRIAVEAEQYYNTADLTVPAQDPEPVPLSTEPVPPVAIHVVELPRSGWKELVDRQARGTTNVHPHCLLLIARGGAGVDEHLVTASYTHTIIEDFPFKTPVYAAVLATELDDMTPTYGTCIELCMTGIDKYLPDVEEDDSPYRAHIVCGNEIMWWYAPELVGQDRYRLSLIRARYGTRKSAHPAGTPALLFVMDQPSYKHFYDIYLALHYPPEKLLTTATSKPLRVRVKPKAGGKVGDTVQTDVSLKLLAALPAGPYNVRVNGDGTHPSWRIGQDLVVSWTDSNDTDFTDILPVGKTTARFYIITITGDKGTVVINAGKPPDNQYTIPSSVLLQAASKGTGITISVRAGITGTHYLSVGDHISL